MPGGRPTLYDPAYCDKIVAFCKDGSSLSSFAASLGIARQTLTDWGKEHPEFLLAVKAAKAQVAAWYDQKARGIVSGEQGNATLCIFGLKNFDEEDFRDKVETHLTGHIKTERVERIIVDPANTDS